MNYRIGDITVNQIELMKHAIGFSQNKVTGTKHRVMYAFRNHFCDTVTDDWENLVKRGLARRTEPNAEGIVYYSVTADGLEFLGKLCRMKIVEMD